MDVAEPVDIAAGDGQAALRVRTEGPVPEDLVKAIRFFRRSPLALLGTVILVVWVLAAIFAPFLAPYGPIKQDLAHRLASPGSQHWLGTDQLGRDIFSRIIYGGRISLPIGLFVVAISTVVGTVLGAVAGYFGGVIDTILMRVTDMVMGFPAIILAMSIAAALGAGLEKSVMAIVVVWWPFYARVVRSLVLSVKNHEYVAAAHAVGCTERHILMRTVLPNCMAPAVVMATLDLGNAILTFAGLSFLGLGAVPPAPEWGTMVANGVLVFDQWWVSTFPGLAILTVVMAFNFVGDGLRDVLDPRLRRSG